MTKFNYTLFFVLISINVFSQEQTYDVSFFKNVKFPNVINVENESLKLNGHGMHSEGVFKLFVCGLYVYERTDDPNKIIYDDHAKMIEMVITSNQFQSDKTIEEVDRTHDENMELMKSGELSDMVNNIKKYDGIIPHKMISVDQSFRTLIVEANKGEVDDIGNEIDTFLSIFQDEIKMGDHFRITFHHDELYLSKNNDDKITIQSKKFQKCLMNIFIGNMAFNKSLKEDLLSKGL
ncbi:chalcone isomerase family protein [Flammeovirga sp. EKP202]|uniref:chalcone isomerase family protein n=1 Tax=Flammeovirga sp. EKP202 TaxID=2770592 RepID=UPI00165FC37A|nr:chalcone isomerase family protein [Flammeovirga sp. EKP202]MBD0400785.1 chalcone isomerase family protein [Flammeovirga sp. EKP202]